MSLKLDNPDVRKVSSEKQKKLVASAPISNFPKNTLHTSHHFYLFKNLWAPNSYPRVEVSFGAGPLIYQSTGDRSMNENLDISRFEMLSNVSSYIYIKIFESR